MYVTKRKALVFWIGMLLDLLVTSGVLGFYYLFNFRE